MEMDRTKFLVLLAKEEPSLMLLFEVTHFFDIGSNKVFHCNMCQLPNDIYCTYCRQKEAVHLPSVTICCAIKGTVTLGVQDIGEPYSILQYKFKHDLLRLLEQCPIKLLIVENMCQLILVAYC